MILHRFGEMRPLVLGVRRPHCHRFKASVSFYEAEDPIGVVSFHRHMFIGLNFLVKNTPISCPLLVIPSIIAYRPRSNKCIYDC